MSKVAEAQIENRERGGKTTISFQYDQHGCHRLIAEDPNGDVHFGDWVQYDDVSKVSTFTETFWGLSEYYQDEPIVLMKWTGEMKLWRHEREDDKGVDNVRESDRKDYKL